MTEYQNHILSISLYLNYFTFNIFLSGGPTLIFIKSKWNFQCEFRDSRLNDRCFLKAAVRTETLCLTSREREPIHVLPAVPLQHRNNFCGKQSAQAVSPVAGSLSVMRISMNLVYLVPKQMWTQQNEVFPAGNPRGASPVVWLSPGDLDPLRMSLPRSGSLVGRSWYVQFLFRSKSWGHETKQGCTTQWAIVSIHIVVPVQYEGIPSGSQTIRVIQHVALKLPL